MTFNSDQVALSGDAHGVSVPTHLARKPLDSAQYLSNVDSVFGHNASEVHRPPGGASGREQKCQYLTSSPEPGL